eukprot:758311-Hanusia_phi.AAC.8
MGSRTGGNLVQCSGQGVGSTELEGVGVEAWGRGGRVCGEVVLISNLYQNYEKDEAVSKSRGVGWGGWGGVGCER